MSRPRINQEVPFVSSGSELLNLVLGGGWAVGRVVNIVGDRSSGKTLLAIEACANFALQCGNVDTLRYVEAESAFDEQYARMIGMPEGMKLVEGVKTIEGLFEDLSGFLNELKGDRPALYVVDSLDALSDASEMERDFDAGSYGAEKAKKLSKLFRQLTDEISKKRCTLLIISQVRDKIGVTFGETKTRSGGRALDFYASQIVWLYELSKLKRTIKGADRTIGIEIRARAKKNKVGIPFRETELEILFNYGIDDESSMLNWLTKNKVLEKAEIKEKNDALIKARRANDKSALQALALDLRLLTSRRWQEIEDALKPTVRKYA